MKKQIDRVGLVTSNALFLASQQIALHLLSILVVSYTARKLGRADYGLFSLAFTFPEFFIVFGSFGLRSVTVREMASARDRAIEILSGILPLRLLLLFLFLPLTIVSAWLLGYQDRILVLIALATLSIFLELCSRIIYDVFQAFEEMRGIALRDIFLRLFTGILALLVLFRGGGVLDVAWVYVLGAMLGLVINCILYVRRFVRPCLSLQYSRWLPLLREGMPFALTGLVSAAYMKIDILMLSRLVDDEAVGIYNAAANLIYKLQFIADAVGTAAFPALAHLYVQQRRDADDVMQRALLLLLCIACPLTFGGIITSSQFVYLLYGGQFSGSVDVLMLLLAALPLMYVNTLLHFVLGAVGRQQIVFRLLCVLLCCNVLLNMVCIPRWHEKGAALATVATELAGTLMLLFFVRNKLSVRLPSQDIAGLGVAVLAMSLTALLLRPGGMLPSIAGAAVVYCGVLVLLWRRRLRDIVRFHRDSAGVGN